MSIRFEYTSNEMLSLEEIMNVDTDSQLVRESVDTAIDELGERIIAILSDEIPDEEYDDIYQKAFGHVFQKFAMEIAKIAADERDK